MQKIFVVEDEPVVRENLVSLLKLNGYDTKYAENGRVALEKLQYYYPDLIISDVMMPEIDGYHLFNQLQSSEDTSSIPFIFLTAKSELEDIRKGMEMGADDYIPKPFKAKDVLSAIEIRLKKKNQNDKKITEIKEHIAKYIPHELRTPLIPVLGYSQMIQDNIDYFDKRDIQEMAIGINDGGKRLHRTIEKFISYGEAEALLRDVKAKSNLKSDLINVDELVKELTEKIAQNFGREKDLQLNLESTLVCTSKNYLTTIIKEITENAFKFSSKESEIDIIGISIDNNYRIIIRNSGIGMTKEQIKKISAFLQFDRDNYQQEGIGLGLITSKLLSQVLGGTLFILSEKNKYTEVIIEISKHL